MLSWGFEEPPEPSYKDLNLKGPTTQAGLAKPSEHHEASEEAGLLGGPGRV